MVGLVGGNWTFGLSKRNVWGQCIWPTAAKTRTITPDLHLARYEVLRGTMEADDHVAAGWAEDARYNADRPPPLEAVAVSEL